MDNNNIDVDCNSHLKNKTKVENAAKFMLDNNTVKGLAELFSALSDSTRVKILHTLSLNEVCVCDISTLLGISVSAISHQLRILRNLRLVKNRREGRIIYYSLDDKHVVSIFNEGLKHIKHR